MPRPLPLRGLAREALRGCTREAVRGVAREALWGVVREAFRGLARDGAPRWRRTAGVFTSVTALAATCLMPGPALAVPRLASCALTRTDAHHSEGVDTWNSSYVRPNHPLDAVLVFLSFPDSAPRTTPAELTSDYFPATSQFFERASYGKFTVRPHPQRDWIRMPHTSTSYAIQRDWNAEHRAAYLRDALTAADKQVDFSRYDIVYFVADPDAPGVDSDATKVVNLDTPLRADGKDIRRVVTVFEKHPPDRLVLAHETGHVFDLPDLYHRPSDSKGDWDTYVGDWDLMGSQFGLAPDLFGWHKWKLGWLEPRQVACVRGAGTTRLTLEPLGAGPGEGGSGSGAAGAEASGAGASGSRARSYGSSGSYGAHGSSSGPGVSSGSGGSDGTSVRSYDSGVSDVAGGVRSYGSGAQAFGSGRGTKLAVVRTGPDSVLAFEARGPAGNDDSMCAQGILVYRVRSETESGGGPIEVLDAHPHSESCWEDSVYPALADAPVALGESYTVPGEQVRIEVEDRTASGAWTVKITTG
ncbi:M6 family metalloprotease domain-containing protein [Streptomyces lutosisoli]|uniref:M6 family metalloprotease domain-containing protein n=1 Tax=Streptomyces lutosisoli TaxID=2665721 RepID=A0ABW2VKK2_9ACTN